MDAKTRLSLALTYILPYFEGPTQKKVVTNLITDLVETVKEETLKQFEVVHKKVSEIKLKKQPNTLTSFPPDGIVIGGTDETVLLYISPATNKILFKGQEINSKELIAALEGIDITQVRSNLKHS